MSDVQLRDVVELPAEVSDRETRLTLRLSPEARQTLDWIAKERDVSLSEVIRRALGTEKFLIEVSKRKARILVDQPGERLKELVLI
jgi:predicted transcriptional regulator